MMPLANVTQQPSLADPSHSATPTVYLLQCFIRSYNFSRIYTEFPTGDRIAQPELFLSINPHVHSTVFLCSSILQNFPFFPLFRIGNATVLQVGQTRTIFGSRKEGQYFPPLYAPKGAFKRSMAVYNKQSVHN